MRFKYMLILAASFAFLTAAAQAGTVRDLGIRIKKGSAQVANTTVHGATTAASDARAAGRATTTAVSNRLSATKNHVESAGDGMSSRGAKLGGVIKNSAGELKTGTVEVARGIGNASETAVRATASKTKSAWQKIW
jgi:hypothetical protein